MGVRSWAARVFRAPVELARATTNYQLYSLYGTPSAERTAYDFVAFADRAYSSNPTVFALANRRSAVFTEATFKFRNLTDKHLHGNAALAKLEQPWPDGTTGDLLAQMIQHADVGGNAFVRDCGDRLECLRPDQVTIISHIRQDEFGHQVREVIGYAFDPSDDPDREPDFFPVGEVAHWVPTRDPRARFRGMSWLTPVIREINADSKMSQFRDAFFSNAATANLIVKYPQKVGAERIKALRAMIESKHAGPDNAFGTLVFDEGGDPMIVGSNMEGAAFEALQAAGETRLASAAGVPPVVAGLRQGLQDSEPGEYQASVRMFVDLTMRPLWRSACAALEKLVDVPGGSQLWYDTTDISALRQGEKDAADTLTELAAAANTFIMAGFEPDTVVAALSSGDVTLLKHTGLTSVQMQKPGSGTGGVQAGTVVPDPASTPSPVLGQLGRAESDAIDAELAAILRAARPGHNQLEHYWTATPEGLAKWADDPHPWTALYHHLLKYLPPNEAKRTAAQWFHKVKHYWPGDQAGANPVGPG